MENWLRGRFSRCGFGTIGLSNCSKGYNACGANTTIEGRDAFRILISQLSVDARKRIFWQHRYVIPFSRSDTIRVLGHSRTHQTNAILTFLPRACASLCAVSPTHLKMIASNLPELDPYKKLAKRIVALDMPYITGDIIEKDLLAVGDMDVLWQAGDINISRSLTGNTTFINNLTNEQTHEIIVIKDRAILENAGENAEYIVTEGFLPEDARLPREISAKLMECLRSCPYGDGQDKLDLNWRLPLKYRLPPAEHIKSGLAPWKLRVEDADENIMDILRTAPYGYILRFAQYLQEVENNAARDSVGEFLISQPDPYIRLELAHNEKAPEEGLQKLLQDGDAYVRESARKSLAEIHEGRKNE